MAVVGFAEWDFEITSNFSSMVFGFFDSCDSLLRSLWRYAPDLFDFQAVVCLTIDNVPKICI